MLLAIIADTHMPRGTRRLPDPCVAHLRAADLIVHAGDFTGASAFSEIESLGPSLLVVHGNVDEPQLARRLPARAEVDLEGVRLAVVHDAGPRRRRIVRLQVAFPDSDAVVFGHSHMPLHESADGFQIFNPGSPTERRRAPARSMGLARVEGGRVEFEHVLLD